MKIAIDISQVVYGTGVSTYTKRLVEALLSIDHENEYVLFAGTLRRKKDIEEYAKGLRGNFTLKVFLIPPTLTNLLWNRLHWFNVGRLIGGIDIVHTSDWSEPPSRARKVTTIHDLTPFKYPEETPAVIQKAHKARLALVKREKTHIIAPSEATKKDLIKMGFEKKLIRVIPEAAGLKMPYVVKNDPEIASYGKYALTVGTAKRKNMKRLIKAFELAADKADLDKLVVVGERPREFEKNHKVIFTGHVSDEKLVGFYKGAKVFVYVSLYEGFGIPILDAFSAHVPVVTSNASSMPEVALGAAVLVDPVNVDSISKGIIKAVNDRKVLIAKGKKRLEKFSWENTAKMTLSYYNDIVQAKL